MKNKKYYSFKKKLCVVSMAVALVAPGVAKYVQAYDYSYTKDRNGEVYAAPTSINSAIESQEQKGTITVGGIEKGATVALYKLTSVNYTFADKQLTDPIYSWEEKIDTLNTIVNAGYQNDSAYDTENNYNNGPEKFAKEIETMTQNAGSFYDSLAKDIRNNAEITSYKSLTAPESGIVTFEEDNAVEMGTYIVIIENSVKIYQVSVVNVTPIWDTTSKTWVLQNPAVSLKSNSVSVVRKVNGEDQDNISTEDTATVTITADVPHYPTNSNLMDDKTKVEYKIVDTLEPGFTPIKDETTGETKVTVTDQDGNVIDESLYTVTTVKDETTGKTTVTIDFTGNYEDIIDCDQIIIEYDVELNENNTTNVTPSGNNGEVVLTYSNAPYTPTSTEEANDSNPIYTYEIDLTKLDKNDTSIALKDVEFELSIKNGKKLKFSFAEDENAYYVSDVGTITKLTTDENGKIKVIGLDSGTYELKEIKAADDYNLPSRTTIIELKDENVDGSLEENSEEQNTSKKEVTIYNTKGFQLPVTGGTGTAVFSGLGIAGVAIGVTLLKVSRRKK